MFKAGRRGPDAAMACLACRAAIMSGLRVLLRPALVLVPTELALLPAAADSTQGMPPRLERRPHVRRSGIMLSRESRSAASAARLCLVRTFSVPKAVPTTLSGPTMA